MSPTIEHGKYKQHKKFMPEFYIHSIDNESEPTKRILDFVTDQRKKKKKAQGGHK